MKILQINTVVNSGSTGRITEDIGRVFLSRGHSSYIAFGRGNRPSQSDLIRIGNDFDVISHGFKTALLDKHGFGSKRATEALISRIDEIQPDIIGLHNLHGYYINIESLFQYIHKRGIPIVWTLFDCWAFTGHCSYFDDINCRKWIEGCYSCPKTRKYPSSYLFDNSRRNYESKKMLFNIAPKLNIIVHSNWLKCLVEQSFLNGFPVHHIYSGIDLNVFKPRLSDSLRRRYGIENQKKIVLGVANIWDVRKGLSDFIKIYQILQKSVVLILIGLTKKQLKRLPPGIIGVERTENVEELASYYSLADVFVNPTYMDNFPTTNIEALACGTPVVTYDTGGSPEAIDEETGKVVCKGDIEGLIDAINEILDSDRNTLRSMCRDRAERLFDKDQRYLDYLNLYESIISIRP